jgi:ubiquinone/menaquinone biosynthesis C-methylase UbiE
MGRIRYLHASMTDLAALESGSVDLVFAGQSIEHITEEEARGVMREVFRVLQAGGHFCLDTINGPVARLHSPDRFLHPEHKVEYAVSHLVAQLHLAGFRVQAVKGIVPMPRSLRTGVYDEREFFDNAHLSDDAESSFLFCVHCVKPG